MLYYYGFLLNQIQASDITAGLAVGIALFGSIISFIGVKLMKNKMEQENKEKMATKEFVLTNIDIVDNEIKDVKIDLKDYMETHRKDHEKEAKFDTEFRDWMRDQMKGLRQDVRDINNKN